MVEMNKRARVALWFLVVFSLVVSVSVMYFVFADHIVTPGSGNATSTDNFNVDEDLSVMYNITINNSDKGGENNITQVNITLWDNFNFTAGTNVTNVTDSVFLNTSNVLSWTNDTYLINGSEGGSSLASFFFNATAATPGTYNITITTMNISGTFQTNLSVKVNDTTAPDLSVITPVNSTNSSDTALDVNYSVSDASSSISTCWWTNDTMSANLTLASCGNITDVTWTAGIHNVTIWSNDSENNINSTIISFIIDLVNPGINITHPLVDNITTDTALNVNYSVTDDIAVGACWYSNDTFSGNTSLGTACANITDVTWVEGQHNVTVWVNDTAGNLNSSSVNFTIDSIAPVISVIYANHTNSSDSVLNINYSVSDATGTVSACWWSNDTMSANTSLTTACSNITGITWAEGQHNVTIWANDSENNIRATSFRFTIDTTGPTVALSSTSTVSSITITITMTESGTGVYGVCTSDRSGATITGSRSTTQTLTESGLRCGSAYTYAVTCTDHASNSVSRGGTFSTSTCGEGVAATGGGVSWKTTHVATATQFTDGFTRELKKEDRMKVTISSVSHYIGVTALTSTTATVQISSTPQTATLSIGDTRRFDVIGDDYYDLNVTLNGIINNKANLTIKSIHEEVTEETIAEEEEKEEAVREREGEEEEEEEEEIDEKTPWTWWIIVIVVIIIAAIVWWIIKKRRQ